MPSEMYLPPRITPRNLHFAFETSLPADWHSGNPAITSFYDALSLTFPEGERFFISSVRCFASGIFDPKLKADVDAFTAQESVHSREHAGYNALLRARGIPVEKFEVMVKKGTAFVQRHLGRKNQLAATCGYEHYTALFAELILGDERVLAGAHPFYRDLWRWHAMEEEEHKAVAFDVYTAAAKDRLIWLRRVVAMIVVTVDLSLTTFALSLWLMKKRGQIGNWKAWAGSFWYLWISPGVWRRVMRGVFAYMAPGFHPWKRKVKPAVLAWRAYYRARTNRLPAASSIFESATA